MSHEYADYLYNAFQKRIVSAGNDLRAAFFDFMEDLYLSQEEEAKENGDSEAAPRLPAAQEEMLVEKARNAYKTAGNDAEIKKSILIAFEWIVENRDPDGDIAGFFNHLQKEHDRPRTDEFEMDPLVAERFKLAAKLTRDGAGVTQSGYQIAFNDFSAEEKKKVRLKEPRLWKMHGRMVERTPYRKKDDQNLPDDMRPTSVKPPKK
jgi:hypothetical protein